MGLITKFLVGCVCLGSIVVIVAFTLLALDALFNRFF